MHCIQCHKDLGNLKRKTCSDECLSKYRSETSTRVNKRTKNKNDMIFTKREKRSRLKFDEEMEKREIESLLNEYR